MSRSILNGGYKEFIDEFFPKTFPKLRAKFPANIEWSFISDKYTGVKKPSDMSQDDFDEFRRIEHEWLLENDFISNDILNPSFVVRVYGLVWIPLPNVKIESVVSLDENFANVNIISLNDDKPHSYCVVGGLDYIKQKLRIN